MLASSDEEETPQGQLDGSADAELAASSASRAPPSEPATPAGSRDPLDVAAPSGLAPIEGDRAFRVDFSVLSETDSSSGGHVSGFDDAWPRPDAPGPASGTLAEVPPANPTHVPPPPPAAPMAAAAVEPPPAPQQPPVAPEVVVVEDCIGVWIVLPSSEMPATGGPRLGHSWSGPVMRCVLVPGAGAGAFTDAPRRTARVAVPGSGPERTAR